MNAAIELDEVSMKRGGRVVLDRVSIRVEAGECVALVGPNGAGKSTVIGVASGDLSPTGGTVLLDGVPQATLGVRDQARMRAVMTQHSAVAFGFTVREVVAMGREPWRGRPESERDDDIVTSALGETDVDHLADRPVQALSGGEQARVALARTLAQDAAVLMWDEPTAALDLKHQVAALGSLRARVEKGCAALLVVHDLTQASLVADRIVLLSRGRIVASGTPSDVFTPATIEATYGVPVAVFSDGGRQVIAPRMVTRE